MECTYTSKDGRLAIKLAGEEPKAWFGQISNLEETVENNVCGVCKEHARPQVRNVEAPDKDNPKKMKKYTYYEMACTNRKCRARLSFGEKLDDESLFPKKKDKDSWLPNDGWVVFKPNSESGAGKSPKKEDESQPF